MGNFKVVIYACGTRCRGWGRGCREGSWKTRLRSKPHVLSLDDHLPLKEKVVGLTPVLTHYPSPAR